MLKFEISSTLAISWLPTDLASSLVLLLAAWLDYLVGDPWGWLHPVQVMGWWIQNYTKMVLKFCSSGWQRRFAGIVLGLGLIIGSGLIGWLLVFIATAIEPILGLAVRVVLLASCFAGKSLRVAVEDVLTPLNDNNLAEARERLSLYVGRDTANLPTAEILRALLETVAENAVDGVTAPLFYAIAGSFCPVGAVPIALAYKAASTLDSIVGYRREPYHDLGWFSAQLEDRLTWLPCRLTILTLAIGLGKPLEVWSICRRDGVKDPSPNSGWSEAAYAAILEVQLGGTNTYQGMVKKKPLLGNNIQPITSEKIYQGLGLTRYCFLSWLIVAILFHWLL